MFKKKKGRPVPNCVVQQWLEK